MWWMREEGEYVVEGIMSVGEYVVDAGGGGMCVGRGGCGRCGSR